MTQVEELMKTIEPRDIPALLEQLAEWKPASGQVLTITLDTAPSRIPGREYLIALRDLARTTRATLSPDQVVAFNKAVESAEESASNSTPGRGGLAIYAAAGPEPPRAVRLLAPTCDHLVWGPYPDLSPLHQAIDLQQRSAVLFFDSEQARILTICLGEIEERRELTADVPPKQAGGGWFALSQKRWDRHRENALNQHAGATVQALLEELRQRPFERLYLAGPSQGLALLRRQLPRQLESRVAGELRLSHFSTDQEMLQATLTAMEESEQAEDSAIVEQLIEEQTSAAVVMGVDPVLEALSEGRMARLLVAEPLRLPGGVCPACGRLAAGSGACPRCEAELTPLADLRSAMLDQAYRQGARVELVRGAAANRLREYGVFGGWTWFHVAPVETSE